MFLKIFVVNSDHLAISFYTYNKVIIFDTMKCDRNATMSVGFPNAGMLVA